MELAEPAQQRRQDVLAEAGARADDQVAGQLAVLVGQLAGQLVAGRQQPAGVPEHDLTPLREARSAAGAVDQRGADVTLQRLDLLADGGLADAERLGGRRERAAVGHRGEGFQLA